MNLLEAAERLVDVDQFLRHVINGDLVGIERRRPPVAPALLRLPLARVIRDHLAHRQGGEHNNARGP